MAANRYSNGVGSAIIRALEAHGVDKVFGIPGTHNLELYRGLASSNMTHYSFRHEQGAVYAADAHARAGGGIVPVITTSGPGILNASAGIANAYADRVPLLVLTPSIDSGRERRDVGWMHEVKDQRAAMDAVSEWTETARDVDDVIDLIHRAFLQWSRGNKRPVVIQIPHDVLIGEARVEDAVRDDTVPPVAEARPQANTGAVSDALRVIEAARRPIVIVGGGCVDAYTEVREFLEALGAPVFATARGKGVLPDEHPLSLGATMGLASARAAIDDADVLVLLGTELSEAELADTPIAPRGDVIRVDIAAAQLHKGARARVPILADVASFVREALELGVPAVRHNGHDELRTTVETEAADVSSPYEALHRVLRRVLPRDSIIVGDSSQVNYLGTNFLWSSMMPDQLLSPLGFATLGYSLPGVSGAKLAQPERTVVGLVGDGAAMFSIQELAAAAEFRLPVPFIIYDNGGFREIRDGMDERGIDRIGVDFESPRFDVLAEAMGCIGTTPDSEKELEAALREALKAERPTVIWLKGSAWL